MSERREMRVGRKGEESRDEKREPQIFGGADSEEKPRESDVGYKKLQEPLHAKSASRNDSHPMGDPTAMGIWSDVDPAPPAGIGWVF